MARGAADAGFHPVIGVLGDSTFLHSGVTGLIDAVSGNANVTVVILDNSTVAMTGGQKTVLESDQIDGVVKGVGVDPDHIRIITPLKKNHEENVKTFREEMDHKGVSVIISRRECIVTAKKKKSTGGAA